MSDATNEKTIIGSDINVTGTIVCESDIQFDGKLEGDLSCSGKAAIGKSAVIKGNATVDSISVMGELSGNIVAKDRIELKATARVNGDIKAKRLTVEDGVTFVGRSEVNPAGVSQSSSSAKASSSQSGSASSGSQASQRSEQPRK